MDESDCQTKTPGPTRNVKCMLVFLLVTFFTGLALFAVYRFCQDGDRTLWLYTAVSCGCVSLMFMFAITFASIRMTLRKSENMTGTGGFPGASAADHTDLPGGPVVEVFCVVGVLNEGTVCDTKPGSQEGVVTEDAPPSYFEIAENPPSYAEVMT